MNLTDMALKYGSDKAGHHNYTPVYERYFEKLRHEAVVLVELGIGGYEYPERGGASLRMWADYFAHPKTVIRGVDLHPKQLRKLSTKIEVYKCDQTDSEGLQPICKDADIIIDDASHVSPLTVRSFNILFPMLKRGGIYVIEDVHTSYWPDHGYQGSPETKDLNVLTTMNYFKLLTDTLNTGPDTDIDSIHFYEKMIFILKKP